MAKEEKKDIKEKKKLSPSQLLKAKSKAGKKGGKKKTPIKYSKKKHPAILEAMAMNGITSVTKLAAAMGIVRDTFYRWTVAHKEFSQAYKRGLDTHMAIASRAGMKKLINGIAFNEVSTKVVKNEDGKGDYTEIKTTRKLIPPDRAMIKYYENNKSAGEFKEKQDVDITSDGEQMQVFNIVVNGKIKEIKDKK